MWLAVRKLVAQILDLHHPLGVAVPNCVDLTMLVGTTATTLVTLRDLVRMTLEVLCLLPPCHFTASIIMPMITILPVAEETSTFAVLTAILFTVLPERQRWGTPVAWLLPLSGCVHLVGVLYTEHFRQYGVHFVYSNFRVGTLGLVSGDIACATTALRRVLFGGGAAHNDGRVRLPNVTLD